MKQILSIVFFSICSLVQSQSPYTLDLKKDLILSGIGLGLATSSKLVDNSITPLSVSQINSLSKDNINAFDRGAVDNYNQWSGTVSDVAVYSCMASPLLLLPSKKIRKDIFIVGAMYGETLWYSFFLPAIAKGSIQRVRPFVYNPLAPLDKKQEIDAQRSFFSSHTAMAFSSAIFFSSVYSTYFPKSKLKPYIWGSSILIASGVGFMRYNSGNHFPTDILVGAAIGGSIGYLIPHIHKSKSNSNLTVFPIVNEHHIELSMNYQFK